MHPKELATLARVQELFPQWDVYIVFGGYLAVPTGTPVIRSTDPGDLGEKIIVDIARGYEAEQSS